MPCWLRVLSRPRLSLYLTPTETPTLPGTLTCNHTIYTQSRSKQSIASSHAPWTPAEEQLLTSLHKAGVQPLEIAQRLEGRSVASVLKKRASLGLALRKHKAWSSSEDEKLLRLRSQGHAWKDIALEMGDRTLQALMMRLLTLNSPEVFTSQYASVREKWSEEEDQKLLQLKSASKATWPEIAREFPSRHPRSLQTRFQKLTLAIDENENRARRPWTDDDYLELVKLREAGIPVSDIARRLSRSHTAIRMAFCRSKGQVNGHIRKWTEEDILQLQLLRRQGMPMLEIAHRLGRSLSAISARLTKMRESG